MHNDHHGLIGTVYENAYVYGMLDEEDRTKWYENTKTHGVETADEKLIVEENRGFIDLENDGIPWSMWVVAAYNPNLKFYFLLPFTCDDESQLVKENEESFLIYNPIKMSGIFHFADDSIHDLYCLQGYPIIINEDELLKYHKHLTVYRTILSDLKEINIGELYNA